MIGDRSTRERGQEAEQAAARFLERQGYRVLDRNFTTKFGEIDLICEKDGILVFVEVRSLRSRTFHPLQTLTRAKMDRVRKAAEWYLTKTKQWGSRSCRFDIVGAVREGESWEILHIPDAYRW